jgi:hypothetical protein
MSEENYVKKNFGKWSQKDVPHKGWICIDIEDFDEPTSLCEMCESKYVRYVHYMKHPNYKDILGVGCVCAGNMEENICHAKKRDDFMKSRSNKRKKWINHRSWKISKNGNPFIKADGYIVVMVDHNSYWNASIKKEKTKIDKWEWLPRRFDSINTAKLAAFDYVTKLLADY